MFTKNNNAHHYYVWFPPSGIDKDKCGPKCGHDHGLTEDKLLAKVFRQNEEWRKERLAADPKFFEQLGANHNPKCAALLCGSIPWVACLGGGVPQSLHLTG